MPSTDPSSEHPPGARAGFCAILGLPNVGKSTLLNRALGLRLAAVSPRPQTTRNRLLGVVNLPAPNPDGSPAVRGPAQIVYLDTPGVQQGRTPLRHFMREEAMSAAGECDVALVLIDASDRAQRAPEAPRAATLLEALSPVRAPALLALNKVDRLAAKSELLPIIDAYAATGRFDAIVPISALSGDGVDPLQAEIAARLPEGPPLFPQEMYTDRAERFLAGELIREQLFRQLGDEVPYATAVVVESFEERRSRGDVVVSAVIHVERESQKAIVVGKGGARIKQVGVRAREAIAQLLGCPVHVKLLVKVAPGWSRDARRLRDMGYE
jgi:GTP-binding protein Era